MKAAKTFDAVQMMRETRNKISAETQQMSFAELKQYIQNQLKASQSTAGPRKGLYGFSAIAPERSVALQSPARRVRPS